MKKTILYIAIVSLIIFLNGYYNWYYFRLALSGLAVIFYPTIFFLVSKQNTPFKKILVFSAVVSLMLLSFYYQIVFVVYLISIPFIFIYFGLIKKDESFKRFLKDVFLFILTLIILGIIVIIGLAYDL